MEEKKRAKAHLHAVNSRKKNLEYLAGLFVMRAGALDRPGSLPLVYQSVPHHNKSSWYAAGTVPITLVFH